MPGLRKLQIFLVSMLFVFGLVIFRLYGPSPDFLQTDVTISSDTEYTSDTVTNDNVTIQSGKTVTLSSGIVWQINGDLTVNGTILFRDLSNTYTQYPTLRVSGNLTVSNSGLIDASGQGFPGGDDGNNNGQGNGGGVSSQTGGGGGHGGNGGRGYDVNSLGGTSYGSNTLPVTAGSGGAGGSKSDGESGGGVIRIEVTRNIMIDGSLLSDGINGEDKSSSSSKCGGGGAGGSISLTTQETFSGNGVIRAQGGRGGNCSQSESKPGQGGGGGGGGRIAYYYKNVSFNGSISAPGGAGGDAANDGLPGSSGSLYSEQYTFPNQPSLTSPTANSSNISRNPNLTTSAYSGQLQHLSSDWEIATDASFTANTLVAQKLSDATNLISSTVNGNNFLFLNTLSGKTALSSNTTYFVRVRHTNVIGVSAWSPTVTFTTALNTVPAQPSMVSPSPGSQNQSRALTVSSNAFSDADSDSHLASSWEVASDSNFSQIVALKENDAVNKTSIAINANNFQFQGALSGKTQLQPNTLYYVRVKYIDSENGISSPSQSLNFTTAVNSLPSIPVIQSPADRSTGVDRNPVIVGSTFSDADNDSHVSSDFEIATDSSFQSLVAVKYGELTNLTSLTVAPNNFTFQNALASKTQLAPSATYYARIRYFDKENGDSSYSPAISFTTLGNRSPLTPSFSSPTNNATNQARNQVLLASNFSDLDPDDTHLSTDFEVASDSYFSDTSLVAYKYEDTVNKTTIRIDSTLFTFKNALAGFSSLAPNNSYFVRVRFRDSWNQASEWSSPLSFTTGQNYAPNRPNITSPSSNATEVATSPTLASSIFSDADDLIHAASSWEIYDSSTLASSNLVWSKVNDSANKTSIAVDANAGVFQNALSGRQRLLPGLSYYVRTIHMDSASANSEWSSPITFNTVTPPPDPVLTSSSHPSQDVFFQNSTPSFTITLSQPQPAAHHYHILVNQNASPTKLEVESGFEDSDGIFTIPSGMISQTGTWYIHAIAHDSSSNPSSRFASYRVQYDSRAPSVSQIVASNIAANSASLAWNSLNTSNSRVDYGTSSGVYSWSGTDSAFGTAHQINLRNLLPSTTYYYRVISVDQYSQTDTSSEYSFTTLALTTISQVQAIQISETSAQISWVTNHPATSKVNYGSSTAYGFDIQDSFLVTSHSFTLQNLLPGVRYFYEIISVGNSTATDAYHTFDTVSVPQSTNVPGLVPTVSPAVITPSGVSSPSFGGGGGRGGSGSGGDTIPNKKAASPQKQFQKKSFKKIFQKNSSTQKSFLQETLEKLLRKRANLQ